MKRLLLIALCLIAFRADAMMLIGGKVIAAVGPCIETFDPEGTQSNSTATGSNTSIEYTGFQYIPGADECICAIDLYIDTETGNVDGKYYYAQIFEVDASTPPKLNSLAGTSDRMSGSGINGVNNTWFSAATGSEITFSPCVEVTSGTKYGIVVFPDTDSIPNDDPECDASNYFNWGWDSTGTASEVIGIARWVWDNSIPYENNTWDSGWDPLVKVHTQ